jgi:hypothetical protein
LVDSANDGQAVSRKESLLGSVDNVNVLVLNQHELPTWAACSQPVVRHVDADRQRDTERSIPFDVEGDSYLSAGGESLEATTDIDHLGETLPSSSSYSTSTGIRWTRASLQPLHAGDTCGSSILGIDSTADSTQASTCGLFHFRSHLCFLSLC